MSRVVLRKTSPPRSSRPPNPLPPSSQISVVEEEVALACAGWPEHAGEGAPEIGSVLQPVPQKTPASQPSAASGSWSSSAARIGLWQAPEVACWWVYQYCL